MAPDNAAVTHESQAIAWGLIFLLGVFCVALIELYWRWAENIEDRQDALEARIEKLEDR